MIITADLKNNILQSTKSIEQIEILYDKKKKYNGNLSAVKENPFEISILTVDNDEEPEHILDFEAAKQITVTFFDGTVKTFMDPVDID